MFINTQFYQHTLNFAVELSNSGNKMSSIKLMLVKCLGYSLLLRLPYVNAAKSLHNTVHSWCLVSTVLDPPQRTGRQSHLTGQELHCKHYSGPWGNVESFFFFLIEILSSVIPFNYSTSDLAYLIRPIRIFPYLVRVLAGVYYCTNWKLDFLSFFPLSILFCLRGEYSAMAKSRFKRCPRKNTSLQSRQVEKSGEKADCTGCWMRRENNKPKPKVIHI